MTLEEFRSILVSPFPADARRLHLFKQLERWVTKLRALKVGAILWLNGSFVTEKFGPNDIDCVIWDPHFLAAVSAYESAQVKTLADYATARTKYGIDLYIETPLPSERVHRQAYWRGLFGFQHDGTSAKGFVELTL